MFGKFPLRYYYTYSENIYIDYLLTFFPLSLYFKEYSTLYTSKSSIHHMINAWLKLLDALP